MPKRFKLMPAAPEKPRTTSHPTKEILLWTVTQLLESSVLETITVDLVLKESGVSRGSLYHHFEDFSDLLEQALVHRFASSVDKSIAMLSKVVLSSTNKQQAIAALHKATGQTTSAALAEVRFERARLISASPGNPRLSKRLSVEQWRLTSALADLFREMQNKGWMSTAFDARAAAVLIQAYALGKIVDDIVEDKMSEQAWNQLINRVIDKVFVN